jgi:hypothetical protein
VVVEEAGSTCASITEEDPQNAHQLQHASKPRFNEVVASLPPESTEEEEEVVFHHENRGDPGGCDAKIFVRKLPREAQMVEDGGRRRERGGAELGVNFMVEWKGFYKDGAGFAGKAGEQVRGKQHIAHVSVYGLLRRRLLLWWRLRDGQVSIACIRTHVHHVHARTHARTDKLRCRLLLRST